LTDALALHTKNTETYTQEFSMANVEGPIVGEAHLEIRGF
jgi:hypothetical protein